jgi:hypothetical protein
VRPSVVGGETGVSVRVRVQRRGGPCEAHADPDSLSLYWSGGGAYVSSLRVSTEETAVAAPSGWDNRCGDSARATRRLRPRRPAAYQREAGRVGGPDSLVEIRKDGRDLTKQTENTRRAQGKKDSLMKRARSR